MMIISQCKPSEWLQPPGQGGVWEPTEETRDVTPAPPNPPSPVHPPQHTSLHQGTTSVLSHVHI